MGKVISVANQKGGVGKTTTCVNLGIALAGVGKKVCLIDMDPQGSLTESLGYRNPDEMENILADVLKEDLSLKLGCLPATLYIVGLRPWCKAIIYLFEDSRCSYCINLPIVSTASTASSKVRPEA